MQNDRFLPAHPVFVEVTSRARMNGLDLSEVKTVYRWFHIANMSLNPYQPFFREMTYIKEEDDMIHLKAYSHRRARPSLSAYVSPIQRPSYSR